MSTPLPVEDRLNNLEVEMSTVKTVVDGHTRNKPDAEAVENCLNGKLSKDWGFGLIVGIIVAIALGVVGIMNVAEGPSGADGKDGKPGIIGPVGPQGPAGPSGPAGTPADSTALLAQIDSLRKEVNEIKTRPASAPVMAEKSDEGEPPTHKGGMALQVNEQDGHWIVTSIEFVEKDKMLGTSMWVCKGPSGQPIVAEPGTPQSWVEEYVKFTNPKHPRPAGTVFKAHPKPSKRGSVVWVLVKE